MSTTRSGRSVASPATHSCLRRWSGVMWMSLRCSTRSGLAPVGQQRHLDPAQCVLARLPCGVRRQPGPGGRAGAHEAADNPDEGHSLKAATIALMAHLKDRLRADLTAAIKTRDEVRSSTIRMVLTAITNAEVAGKEARELSDDEVVGVLSTEAKKRREAATAFDDGGRAEMADKERAEAAVIADYLPEQLSEEEIVALVTAAVEQTGAAGEGMKAMGKVMGVVQPQVKGRADGGRRRRGGTPPAGLARNASARRRGHLRGHRRRGRPWAPSAASAAGPT